MRIVERLPEKFSVKWLLVWVLTTLASVVIMLITLGISTLMGATVGGAMIVTVATVLFWNVFVGLIGFLGAKHWYAIAEMGLFAGSAMGTATAMVDTGGWEALVVIYVLIFVGFITGLIGLIVQSVVWVMKKREKNPISAKVASYLWWGYIASLIMIVIFLMTSLDLSGSVNGERDWGLGWTYFRTLGADEIYNLECISGSFEKGGYYPYDNLSFKQVSDYIKEMMSKAVGEDESAYVQLEAVEHSDEDAIVIKLQEVISQQVVLPYFKKKHELFVNEV